MGIYLKPGERFDEVVKRDSEILHEAGLTHEQVADSLELVVKAYNPFKARKENAFSVQVNPSLTLLQRIYQGWEECPYDESLWAATDYFIAGIPNGNKTGRASNQSTMVSAMLPELIRKLHFFEGEVPYGIKPQWAITIFQIVKKEGITLWTSQKEVVFLDGGSTGYMGMDLGPIRLRNQAERKIE